MTQKPVRCLREFSLFSKDDQLRNISNGISSSPDFNVNEGDTAGEVILSEMTGKILKRQVFIKNQVTPLNTKNMLSSVIARRNLTLFFK